MDRRFDNSTLLSTKTKVGNAYTTQPLPPQGLFISSITNKAPKSTTDTWHLFTHLMPTLSSLHRIKYLNYFNQQQSPHSYSLSLLIHLFPQRSYQIHRSLSPSRIPLAFLNLTAIFCHSSSGAVRCLMALGEAMYGSC